MADFATGKQWRDLHSRNIRVPPAFEREHSSPQVPSPICISINTIDGLTGKGEGDRQPDYQVYVSLYDLSYRQFFGRQWAGPLAAPTGGGNKRPRLKYNQSVYFHTSINNTNVIAVVEVIALTTDSNGKPRKVSCGWSIVRMFHVDNEIPDTSRGSNLPTQKVQLNYGTPRALFFMDEPIEDNVFLKPIPDCHLTYTVGTHKSIYKIMSLIPQNVLVGGNDIIPGLVDGHHPGKDQLKKPKLLKQVPIQIDGLQIHLPPNVEKFEDELCEHLHRDKEGQENKSLAGSSVSIVERRIRVGVHNGWNYLEKPETLHLEIFDETTKSLKPQASPSMRRSKRFHASQRSLTSSSSENAVTCLLMKNKVELNEVFEDPMCAVVFTLEYVVGELISEEDRKLTRSMARSNTHTVTIRWGVWNPFFQPNNHTIQISLMGGPMKTPDDELIFKMPDTKMQQKEASKMAGGTITLHWHSKDGLLGAPMSSSHLQFPLQGSMASMRSEGSEALLMDSPTGKKPPSGKQSMLSLHPSNIQYPMMGLRQPSMYSLPQSDPISSSRSGYPQNDPMTLQVPQQPYIQPQMVAQQYSSMLQPQMSGIHPGVQPVMQTGVSTYLPVQQGMPAYGHDMQHTQRSVGTIGPEMHEVPYAPPHAPIMAPLPQPDRRQGLSRAAYAKLYSANFPAILDRNNEPPEVLDLNKPWMVDLEREAKDPLQSNEIVFQFLAFSKSVNGDRGSSSTGGTVFFTFQFYRLPQVTTERVMLCRPKNELVSDQTSMPFIIQKLEEDGSISTGPAGLQIKYEMDPLYMKPGENAMFLQHLYRQTLYIDVWDGETLFLIGQCAVELKYLCRNGNEAVQSTFELDVIQTEYDDDPNRLQGGQTNIQPVGVRTQLNGKLHFRMANVGQMVDPKTAILGRTKPSLPQENAPLTVPSKSQVIVSQTAGNISYPGGSLEGQFSSSSKQGLSPKKKVARAQHIAEKNQEVAQLLFSHTDQTVPQRDEGPREGDSDRRRKLARMEAIRQMQGIDNKFNTVMSFKTEKQERMRDYKTLEIYRLQTKKDGIINMLSQSISTEHVIHPSFASTEFFEFVLKNPYNVQQTITIENEDSDLRVVTDAREWRFYKQINNLHTQVEEDMFNKESTSIHPQIFLRPKETVHIPFKYLTFTTDQSVKPQGPQDPFKAPEKNQSRKADHSLQTKFVRVLFKGDGKAVSILQLKIEPQPHVIDQTFRFYHPEQSFLKKSIRLPAPQTLPGAPAGGAGLTQMYVRCSDSNVITESKAVQTGEPVDIFLKAALGASPQIKRFFLAIYADSFLTRPVQIWQFYIHSLQRVDVSCVEGQTSRFNLLLRGTQASRLVRCFSSHPHEMQLYPSEQFMLAAGAVHELSVAVRPLKEGNKHFYLNVVDVEYHQLIRSWLICVSCRSPLISRAFELKLPVGGGKGSSKKITYTNPYPHKREFHILSNKEDLVQFRENHIEIEGGDTYTIGLKFIPVLKPGVAEILVFINDEEDKNEETFKITASYV